MIRFKKQGKTYTPSIIMLDPTTHDFLKIYRKHYGKKR